MPRETLLQILLFLIGNIPVAVHKSQLYVSSQPHPTLISLSIYSRLHVSALNASHYRPFVNAGAGNPKMQTSPFTLQIRHKRKQKYNVYNIRKTVSRDRPDYI